MWTQHNYYSPAYYRITWPQQSTAVSTIGKNFEVLPSSDEISQYVKIKENMYAYCLTEEMMERKLGAAAMARSNNMVFIQTESVFPDIARCRQDLFPVPVLIQLVHGYRRGRPVHSQSSDDEELGSRPVLLSGQLPYPFGRICFMLDGRMESVLDLLRKRIVSFCAGADQRPGEKHRCRKKQRH